MSLAKPNFPTPEHDHARCASRALLTRAGLRQAVAEMEQIRVEFRS